MYIAVAKIAIAIATTVLNNTIVAHYACLILGRWRKSERMKDDRVKECLCWFVGDTLFLSVSVHTYTYHGYTHGYTHGCW